MVDKGEFLRKPDSGFSFIFLDILYNNAKRKKDEKSLASRARP